MTAIPEHLIASLSISEVAEDGWIVLLEWAAPIASRREFWRPTERGLWSSKSLGSWDTRPPNWWGYSSARCRRQIDSSHLNLIDCWTTSTSLHHRDVLLRIKHGSRRQLLRVIIFFLLTSLPQGYWMVLIRYWFFPQGSFGILKHRITSNLRLYWHSSGNLKKYLSGCWV